MKDQGKNRFLKWTEFLRYRKNELTGRERNSVERELQKDPFASEAMEGYESVDSDVIQGDIDDLHSRLKRRISGKGRIIFYRIAASIAILIAISSLFILTIKKNPTDTIAENYARPETLEVRRSQPVFESEISKLQEGKVSQEKKKDTKEAKAPDEEMNKEKMERIPETAGEHAAAQAESKKAFAETDLKRAPAAAMAREKSSKLMEADNAISAWDSLHYAIISPYSELAENEGYSPPQPVIGEKEFDKYVKKNIRYPESFSPGEKIAVTISFHVRNSGSIENFNVEKSTDKSFSDEAIRLIKEGPAWKPAEKEGKISEDKVRVTIIFR